MTPRDAKVHGPHRRVVHSFSDLGRLKELFASKRGIALPSASYPLSRTSLTDSEEPEDDQENAKPKQEQESAALTRRHDEAPCSIKQDEAARQARLRPAVKRPGVGSRVEAERARLEKVDEQRRSLKQRRDAEAAYEEVMSPHKGAPGEKACWARVQGHQ